MLIVGSGDKLPEMSNSVFLGKIRKNISRCCLLKFYPECSALNCCHGDNLHEMSNPVFLVKTRKNIADVIC